MPISLYPDNSIDTNNFAAAGGGRYQVDSITADKTIYERQTGLKLVFDTSLGTVIFQNDTTNQVRISFSIDFYVNSDYGENVVWKKAIANNIIVDAGSSSFLTSYESPFDTGTVTNDTEVAFTDTDLVNWYINSFSIFQYDGLWSTDSPILSFEEFSMKIIGNTDYNLTSQYVYVGWSGSPVLTF